MRKSLLALCAFFVLSGCGHRGVGPGIARIDGHVLTQDEFDLHLHAQSRERGNVMLKDPEARREAFETFLRKRLYALAGKKAAQGALDSLRRRQASLDQHEITRFYFQTFLNEYGGHTRKEIEEYYRRNPGRFKDDSGHVPPVDGILSRVADTMMVAKVDLDSFYRANPRNYLVRAHCDLRAIQAQNRAQAQSALQAIKRGMKFEEAAAAFAIDASKSSQGRIGRVTRGDANLALGEIPMDSLLFDPATRLKPGEISAPIPRRDSTFILLRPDSCKEETLPPLGDLWRQVAENYIREVKERLVLDAVAALKAKYKVRTISSFKPPSEREISDYYAQNKEDYESPEAFDLYHIESSSKEALASKIRGVEDLEGFKTLAKRISGNAWTRSLGGRLGPVKRDFCLPYGIGMMPALFPALDAAQPGKIPDPVQSPDTRKWHAFWLAGKIPRAVKPLERVKILVKQDLVTNRITEFKPEDTMAVVPGRRVFRERDAGFLRDEFPPQVGERYTRENLTDLLITREIIVAESEALGLMEDRSLQASRLDKEDGFWGRFYEDSRLSRSWEEDTAALAGLFARKRGVFTRDTADRDWRPYVRDLAAYLQLTPKDFEIEWRTNLESYRRGTQVLTLGEAEFDVFQRLKGEAYIRLDAKVLAVMKKRFQVHLLDPSLEEPSYEPADKTYLQAQGLHKDRKLDRALALYGKLREKFPDRNALQDKVAFGIAQIYLEQELFQPALAEYRRIGYLYPDSPISPKALFMEGFILAQHLKDDSAAVRTFEKMLEKYPGSDLADEAEWMIRNIRGGGNLIPAP